MNKKTKTVNLIPLVVDAFLEDKGHDPVLRNAELTSFGKWYVALTAHNQDFIDCLNPTYENQEDVEKYVVNLRHEYLCTSEYIEVYLKAQ